MNAIDLCERGVIPDFLARAGMRRLIARRLRDEVARGDDIQSFLRELRDSPIAIETDAANEQHYELPPAFFDLHLGPLRKYSCALYPSGAETLAEAERAMFELYAERAELIDGMKILDLGCGWGSLSLWLAERYPAARITGLSNSAGQREFIMAEAGRRGLSNLQVVTGSIVDFEFEPNQAGFDRILSVEMFEHMKNYGELLAKLSRWLAADGLLFVHVFAHRRLAYHFEDRGTDDWMSRYFFTGGTMPSAGLFRHFQDNMALRRQWWLNGEHYERTANHWLQNLDDQREQVMEVLCDCYGEDAELWFQRWRMFYMAVAELFGFRGGSEWGVAHYLFAPRIEEAVVGA